MKIRLSRLLVLGLALLLCACSAPTGQSSPATQQSTPATVTLDPNWVVLAEATCTPNATVDLSKTSLIMSGYQDELTANTLFSATLVEALELDVAKAGQLSVSVCHSIRGAFTQERRTLNVKAGKQTLLLDALPVPEGHTLVLGGQGGDTAVLNVAGYSDSATCAWDMQEQIGYTVPMKAYIGGRLEQNLIGLSIKDHFDIEGDVPCTMLEPPVGPVVFCDDYFGGTTVTKLNIFISFAAVGDVLTVSVVEMPLHGGARIQNVVESVTITFTEELEDQWYTWEGSLTVPEGHTLAFLNDTDTAWPAYTRGRPGKDILSRRLSFFQNTDVSAGGLVDYLLIDAYGTKNLTSPPVPGLAPLPTYQQSQLQQALQGKTLSILGDSISTFEDVSNNTQYNSTIANNAVYYYSGRSVTLEETWWQQLLDRNQMSLCVNNSWSGSWIFNQAAWEQRCVNLHNDHTGQKPDVILVYMGTNDYINHIKMDNLDGTLGNTTLLPDSLIVSQGDGFTYGTPTNIIEAFAVSLHKMKQAYPQAKILVMTPYTYKGLADEKGGRLVAMSAQLKALCQKLELECIDLFNDSAITFNSAATYTHGDGLHPNAHGMDAITYAVEKALWKSYCAS